MRGCTFIVPMRVASEQRHVHHLVRNDRARGRGLDERVDVNDLRTATKGLRQRGEHARCIRRGIDSHYDEEIRRAPNR